MTCPELDILEPKDPSIENWDDWPTYSLRKTSIISQKTGKPTSLLKAHEDNPVKISGFLETIDSDQSHLVRDPKYRSKTIEVVNVVAYAFAEFQDGSYGFWAAGKAGWFEVKEPVSACQESYNMMKEAASMFYHLADKLRKARKNGHNLSRKSVENYANNIFREYLLCEKNYLCRATEDEVREGFHTHSEFLITSMLEGQEGLSWLRSVMFSYFKRKFPEQVSEIQVRLFAPQKPKMKPEPLEEKQTTPEEATTKGSNKRKRGVQPPAEQSVKPDSGSEQDTTTSDETNEVIDNPRAKRKSILQLAGSKFSKKAAGRRKSLPPTNVEVTEPDVEVESADGGLAQEEEEEEEEEETAALPLTNGKQISSHTRSHQPTMEASPALYHEYMPRKYADVKVVDFDLPSCQPDGPGDLWTCPFDTCNHKVQEASTAAGTASIKDHFKAHAQEAQEKIDLVYKESRPYLPVDNLVRRLQNFVPRPDMFSGSPSAGSRSITVRSLY